MNVIERLVRADPWRRSRFHDMRGNAIGTGAAMDVPRVLAWSALRELLGRRPALPWIPYDAIRRIASRLRPDAQVLEFGAGMSTLWFASRCAFVHSIEADASWHELVAARLAKEGRTNVRLELRSEEEEFAQFEEYADGRFDLVMVDGSWRRTSMVAALRLVKPDGAMYLDNTDFDAQWDWYGQPEAVLREAADRDRVSSTYITGFPPATFVANQGLLVEWDRPAATEIRQSPAGQRAP